MTSAFIDAAPIGSFEQIQDFAQPLPNVLYTRVPEQYHGDGLEQYTQQMLGRLAAFYKIDCLTIGDSYTRERGQTNPRHYTDPDHHWHSDRSHLSISQTPDLTVLVAKEIDGSNVPPTSVLDTTKLLEIVLWETGFRIEDLLGAEVVLSRSKFYDTLIHSLNDEAATARALEGSHATDLPTKAYERSFQFPAVYRKLIQQDQATGRPCLYIDTLRTRGIAGIPSSTAEELHSVADDILNKASSYPGLMYEHQWKTGDMLVFPQIGTLHKAHPGNNGTRVMQRQLLYAS